MLFLSLTFIYCPLDCLSQGVEIVSPPFDLKYVGASLEIEALYLNHKTIHSRLLARTAIEETNELLHTLVKDNTEKYTQINVDLDKYSRMFDWIDLLVNGLHSGLHAKRSIENIGCLAEEYAGIISDFAKEVEETKVIRLNDAKLLELFVDAVQDIRDECESMYATFTSLTIYVTPVPGTGNESPARCNPHTLYIILEQIDSFLTSLENRMSDLVSLTSIYILERKGYWHEEVMRVERKQIALEALERWKSSGSKVEVNK